MKKIVTSIFTAVISAASFSQAQFQVPLDYTFATHFSNSLNDELGQIPTGSGSLGDGFWSIQNSGVRITEGQSLKYSNENCRPSGDMTMIVNSKMDIPYWDNLPNFSYYTIFSNGEHIIRILKGGNIQFVVKNGNDAVNSFGYHIVEIQPGAAWPTIQENWTVYQLIYNSMSGMLYATVKSGADVYLSSYAWSGGGTIANSTEYPLQYAIGDTIVEVGFNNPSQPTKMFQGEIDYAYIYNRAIGSGESDNFLFNLDENLIVNPTTNTISMQQSVDLVPGFLTYQWFSVEASGMRTDLTGETAATYTPTTTGTYGVKMILPGDYITISEYKTVTIGSTIGLNEANKEIFQIYPNPATDILSIQKAENSNLEIIDLTGKTVLNITNYNGSDIPINQLMNGIYLVKLTKNGVTGTNLFLKN